MRDPLLDHYATQSEASRLTRSAHGRLEYTRTQELLRRLLPPPPARLLDVGGGTGIHAEWLAADGYQVHVIDLVDHHLVEADTLPGVTATQADARMLPMATGSVDALLLLGPLYHLARADQRQQALAEAGRVLQPGGVCFVAVISRYLSLLETGSAGTLTEDLCDRVYSVIARGSYDGHVGFVAGTWHTADSLSVEMAQAGFRETVVYGIEGPSWPALDAIGLAQFDSHREAALLAARLVERDPLMLQASAHLMAVARA